MTAQPKIDRIRGEQIKIGLGGGMLAVGMFILEPLFLNKSSFVIGFVILGITSIVLGWTGYHHVIFKESIGRKKDFSNGKMVKKVAEMEVALGWIFIMAGVGMWLINYYG